jgi:hypothetical protein
MYTIQLGTAFIYAFFSAALPREGSVTLLKEQIQTKEFVT